MVQIIKCKCGNVFAASTEPECYSDSEWQKNLRNYIKEGCTVEMVEESTWQFQKCVCNKVENSKPITNQLGLF